MPPAVGDRGVFVCGPDDIAPWESAPVRKPVHAGAGDAHERAAGPTQGARRRAWLVLALCLACRRRGSYCSEHDARNWWLTRSGLGRGKPMARPGVSGTENAPGPGVDTGEPDA